MRITTEPRVQVGPKEIAAHLVFEAINNIPIRDMFERMYGRELSTAQVKAIGKQLARYATAPADYLEKKGSDTSGAYIWRYV